MNVFAIESQIGIMAAAAGMDAPECRPLNMADARMRRMLTTRRAECPKGHSHEGRRQGHDEVDLGCC